MKFFRYWLRSKENLYHIYIIIALIICSCGMDDTSEKDIFKQNREYLESFGYEILSEEGVTHAYILEKEMLGYRPYSNIWQLQEVNPEDYIDEEIISYSYIVKNHKLDGQSDLEGTKIILWVCKGEIIGGTSMPNSSQYLFGEPNSLHGLTLKEVKGMDYKAFREEWEKKYPKDNPDRTKIKIKSQENDK